MAITPPTPVAKVVDTTGAGDAWNGAFLHAILAGSPPRDAAVLANQVAVATLGRRGAIAH